MKQKYLILVGGVFIVGLLMVYYFVYFLPNTDTNVVYIKEVNNFQDCVEVSGTIMESYPKKCSNDNKIFVEDIGTTLDKIDLIRVTSPVPNGNITSPLIITGEARGYWFFEATFPITLLDNKGNVVAQHFATAENNWMTEDFVPFSATLEFDKKNLTIGGMLVLHKSNASGLPEHDDSLEIPILIENKKIIEYTCPKDAIANDFCTLQYDPVCAKVKVDCVTVPCYPVLETFSNPCEACRNERVESYSPGAC